MLVLSVMLGGALVSGGVAGLVVWWWPRVDPAAPQLAPATIVEEVGEHSFLRRFARRRLDPKEATGLLLSTALVVVIGGVVAVGALLLMVDEHSGLARYDLSAARFAAAHATATSTDVFRGISYLGTTPVAVGVVIAVAALVWRRAPVVTVVAFFVTTLVGEVVIVDVTKALVDRPRPHVHHLTSFSGSSFPSGHAATAAALWATTALVLGRGRSRQVKAWLAAAGVGSAIGVAGTRVLLGVHWTTDVLAGSAVGWAWFALCSIAFGGRVLRFGRPVEVAEEAVASGAPRRRYSAGTTSRSVASR